MRRYLRDSMHLDEPLARLRATRNIQPFLSLECGSALYVQLRGYRSLGRHLGWFHRSPGRPHGTNDRRALERNLRKRRGDDRDCECHQGRPRQRSAREPLGVHSLQHALGPWHVLLCGWGGGEREQVQRQGGLCKHDMFNAGLHCSGLAHDLQLYGEYLHRGCAEYLTHLLRGHRIRLRALSHLPALHACPPVRSRGRRGRGSLHFCSLGCPSADLCDACRGHMLRIPRGLYRGRHRGIWPARSFHWCDLASDCGECRRTCNRRHRGLQGQDGPSIGGRGGIIDADSFACGAILGHRWLGI
mmetsp:Transcript_30036/g.70743  ORF Transcript_30036/g.70743 Transcript_30036/m.70743 type:complete len:301 (+) Transcript_30036:284-1186(+)